MAEFSGSLRDKADPRGSDALVSEQHGIPRIAVIVPLFNAPAWIESCIPALSSARFVALEQRIGLK